MLYDELTPLKVLSFTAFGTTVAMLFCGLPICYNIWKRKSSDGFSVMPFWVGVLSGSFWLRYGLLKMDYTMISVNVAAIIIMLNYLAFYSYFCTPKKTILLKILALLSIISTMLLLVEIFGRRSVDALGFTCMALNIASFGAPLAGIKVVISHHTCETMPLPLCIANFLVSLQWMFYGILIQDIYLIVPNGTGVLLSIVQLSLFVIFPLHTSDQSLIERILVRSNKKQGSSTSIWSSINETIQNNRTMPTRRRRSTTNKVSEGIEEVISRTRQYSIPIVVKNYDTLQESPSVISVEKLAKVLEISDDDSSPTTPVNNEALHSLPPTEAIIVPSYPKIPMVQADDTIFTM
ncbi:hypothetical protein AB6A40_003263 [Gnathostoma spinigerum]|uniref:Sugar transporter SWEET1 n=1 Tax=Gnathostoma spinigerum TaxID=75299 RepID=A0ABD6EEJ8_9BILA